MPTGSVAEVARLWCECEPVDVFVAFFVELPREFVEDAALDVMRFFGHHRTVQKNNLRIGIGIADGLQEIAVGPFVETCIVVLVEKSLVPRLMQTTCGIHCAKSHFSRLLP